MGSIVIKKYIFVLIMPLVILGANPGDSQESEVSETNVSFHNFPWGTSIDDVIKKMGKPISREHINGLESVIWEGVIVKGYTTYMLAYFSKTGLQGGTYYFLTYSQDELMRCYSELRQDLRNLYGPTHLFDRIIKEMRPYECSWTLPGGYVYLKVNTRLGEPITLWYSSPELTKQMFGEPKKYTPKS
jgi:hypothetical protein